MKNRIFLFALIFSLVSCEIEARAPYYRFSKSNYKHIPTVYKNIGKKFMFKNQLNEEVKMEVLDCLLTKESGGGINFTQPYTEQHYYQLLTIKLKVVDENTFVSNCDFKTIQVFKSRNNYMGTRFNFSNAPNPCDNGGSIVKLEFPYDMGEMNINSIVYDKVVTLFNNHNIFFHCNYFIDKIYFDFKHGIIGFDDTENNIEFRIINE